MEKLDQHQVELSSSHKAELIMTIVSAHMAQGRKCPVNIMQDCDRMLTWNTEKIAELDIEVLISEWGALVTKISSFPNTDFSDPDVWKANLDDTLPREPGQIDSLLSPEFETSAPTLAGGSSDKSDDVFAEDAADSSEGQGDDADASAADAADAADTAKDKENETENLREVLSRISNEIQQVNSSLKMLQKGGSSPTQSVASLQTRSSSETGGSSKAGTPVRFKPDESGEVILRQVRAA